MLSPFLCNILDASQKSWFSLPEGWAGAGLEQCLCSPSNVCNLKSAHHWLLWVCSARSKAVQPAVKSNNTHPCETANLAYGREAEQVTSVLYSHWCAGLNLPIVFFLPRFSFHSSVWFFLIHKWVSSTQDPPHGYNVATKWQPHLPGGVLQ